MPATSFSIKDCRQYNFHLADAAFAASKKKNRFFLKTSFLKNLFFFCVCGLIASHICMPATGIEPVRYCYHRILSPARLPVPPRRRTRRINNGQRRIRTFEGVASRFTVCPLWPLGNLPICFQQ